MIRIRPEILRTYYESTYGGVPIALDAYRDATFEEYVELQRIRFPMITAWRAAMNATREDFRAQAAGLPPDGPRASPRLRHLHLHRKESLDIAATLIDPATEHLLIDKVKLVSGWNGLAKLEKLTHLALVLSGAKSEPSPPSPIEVAEVSIEQCSDACVRAALRATRARTLRVGHYERVLDLGELAAHEGLTTLYAGGAALLRGVRALDRLPLDVVRLGRVEPRGEFTMTLASLSPSLRDLGLRPDRPFAPDILPSLPMLRRLAVPGYPEHRSEWIEFAVKHSQIACDFLFLEAPSTKLANASLEELYRGVDILRVVKGKKVFYEVSGDFTSHLRRGGDNGDLEDRLIPLAKAAKKKINWSSEADALVAHAQDAATCRWLIDQLRASKES